MISVIDQGCKTKECSEKRQWRAFTLVEVLTVMAIIGVLLAVTVGMVGGGANGSKARKGARGEVLALLNRARTEAISRGKPVALAIVGTTSGPDQLRGKALTLYEVRRDESAETWVVTEHLQRWVYLAGTAVLLDDSEAPREHVSKGINVLEQEGALRVEVLDKESSVKVLVNVPCLIFESTGTVVYPSGSGRLEFFIGEGNWHRSKFTVLAKKKNGEAIADRVVVNRLSGRAQEVRSKSS